MSIIIFLIILAVLILVHEFGHFIVAKKSGIRVDEFGLGFPPKLYSKKWGDTLYTLNAIPFGGFVKIFGEDSHGENINEDDKRGSFVHKSKLIQASVLVAGVTFNILFAWVLISFGYTIGIASPVENSAGAKVSNVHVVVTQVLQNSPAQKAGLKTGDYIKGIVADNVVLSESEITPENVQNIIAGSKSKSIEITYVRGKEEQKTIVEPNETIVNGKKAVGIAMDQIGTLKLPIHLALKEGAKSTYFLTIGTAKGLLSFLGNAFTFRSDFSQVTGPIGIVGVVGDATKLGFTYLLTLTALISINLAVINLLPFPALDGGRLLFVAIEAIIRRPISPKFVRGANLIGFSLLLILMVVVSAHDVFKLL